MNINLESIPNQQVFDSEKSNSLEELEHVRDFGEVNFSELDELIDKNKNYWRLPTVGEMFDLFKENKKLFSNYFKYDKYWAKDINFQTEHSKYLYLDVSKSGKFWHYADEAVGIKVGLVMFKIDSNNPEPTKQEPLSVF